MSSDPVVTPRCTQASLRRGLRTLGIATLWLAFGPLVLPLARGQQPATQPPAPVVNGPLVQDLSFIAGNWRGGVAGGLLDEEWSPPSAESMIGMFRYMEAGKVKFYEFMAIEATEAGPVLRLRHFDPGLAAWEDKSAALSLPVAGFSENQVIFESNDKSTRLTYRRSSADSLTVILERTAGGHSGKQEFNFTLIK